MYVTLRYESVQYCGHTKEVSYAVRSGPWSSKRRDQKYRTTYCIITQVKVQHAWKVQFFCIILLRFCIIMCKFLFDNKPWNRFFEKNQHPEKQRFVFS